MHHQPPPSSARPSHRIRRESYIPPSEITPFLFLGGVENAGRHDKVFICRRRTPAVTCYMPMTLPRPRRSLQLAELGITHVLNCSNEPQVPSIPSLTSVTTTPLLSLSPQPPYASTLHLPLRDTAEESIAARFESAFQFIEDCRSRGGRCLLHCQRGISRRLHPSHSSTAFKCPVIVPFVVNTVLVQSLHRRCLPVVVRPCLRRHAGAGACSRV